MFKSRSYPRSNRRNVGMCAVALLAVGLLAPSSAKAAHCGQYVQSQARFLAELDALATGELTLDTSILPGNVPLPPIAPCKGASCSTPPIAPPNAPVAPVSAPGQDGLCLIERVAISPVDSSLLAHEDDEIQPIHSGLSIFHPPRQCRLAA